MYKAIRKNLEEGIAERKCLYFLLITIFSILFNANFIFSQNLTQPYIAPAKDYNPKVFKYIFTLPNELSTSKQDVPDAKPKKIQSILNDSISNNMEITYSSSNLGEPNKLTVTVKEKDKKINITIFNLIGNKVSDVYNAVPGSNEIEIDSFKKEVDKLSNGVYICVLQGQDYRLMRKFTVSR